MVTWREIFEKALSGTIEKLAVLAIVTALSALGGYLWGFSRAEARDEFQIRAAPFQYARLLREQIEKGDRAMRAEGGAKPEDVRVYARSIVQLRDDLRGSLASLLQSLNAELDRLSTLLDQYEKAPTDEKIAREIAVNIRVLYETWPVRQAKIENGVRRVLTDMGFFSVATSNRRQAGLE